MKPRCEAHESVDLAWLSRSGKYDDRTSRVWTYTGGLRISAFPAPWAVTLEVEGKSHHIPLAYTATRFGGRRPWFVCPSCQARRRVLYFSGRGFACRSCLDLRYTSEIEDNVARAARRRRRLLDKLGGSEPGKPFPAKPKGMHWKTYRALEAKDQAQLRSFAAVIAARFPDGAAP